MRPRQARADRRDAKTDWEAVSDKGKAIGVKFVSPPGAAKARAKVVKKGSREL